MPLSPGVGDSGMLIHLIGMGALVFGGLGVFLLFSGHNKKEHEAEKKIEQEKLVEDTPQAKGKVQVTDIRDDDDFDYSIFL